MPRFTDPWVVDKSMFTFVQGGSCACCGIPHLFNPGGIEGLINSMSDLETDAAKKEVNAAKASPWPPEMRDQIWSDRLLLRWKMKKEMRGYREFLEGVVKDGGVSDGREDVGSGSDSSDETIDIAQSIPLLHTFCKEKLTPQQLRQIFQLPRSEVTEVLNSKYKICSAYAILVCSVVEQVANFRVTGYGVDARSGDDNTGEDAETLFERDLKFEKMGPGFCLDIASKESDGSWKVNEDVLSMFLKRVVSLAGPTLLARAAKVTSHDGDSDVEEGDGDAEGGGSNGTKTPDGADEDDDNGSAVPSFRSDRRVVRLLIARYWADRLIEKYRESRTN